MGPRSDNRGYAQLAKDGQKAPVQLQWVHGPITVVMWRNLYSLGFQGMASMGPRSDNRGYVRSLQCVYRRWPASMGPRSDNRGYGITPAQMLQRRFRFNGSTVR